MIRRPLILVLTALLPWLLACLVSVGLFAAFSGGEAARQTVRDFLMTPNAFAPLVVLVALIAGDAYQRSRRSFSASHGLAVGGLVALVSTVATLLVGLAWGGLYVLLYVAAWSMYSGYAMFACLAGAYAWRKLAVLPAMSITAGNDSTQT